MIATLCHFYGLQPSEVKALTQRELAVFVDWRDQYIEASKKAAKGR